MNAILAAVLVLNCQPEEYQSIHARIERQPALELVRISAAEAGKLREPAKAFDFGAFDAYGFSRVVVHAGDLLVNDDLERFVVLLETRGARGHEWWELREPYSELLYDDTYTDRRHVRPRLPDVALVSQAFPLIRIGIRQEYRGMQSSGEIDYTLLIDLRRAPFRMLVVRCANEWVGGRCGGHDSYHSARQSLWCRWSESRGDFRCESNEWMNTGWVSRAASRSFWLLADETIPPSRFDAVTYASGRGFAAAAARDRNALKRRALIDRIGVVRPIFEVSRGTILFAAPARDAAMMVRFFALRLDPPRWREIHTVRLADAGYAAVRDRRDWRETLSDEYTPGDRWLHYDAEELLPSMPGRRLVEVVVTEGDARAIFWVVFDRGETGAIRVATTEAEYRECGTLVRPPSAIWLGVPDEGLPAFVQALPSHEEHLEVNAELPRRVCWSSGTIDFRRGKGWIVAMREAPCTDPSRKALVASIGPYGELGTEPVTNR